MLVCREKIMYYHISPVAGLTELEPRVPPDADYGEPSGARVCAAPSVGQCLSSIYIDTDKVVTLHVYQICAEPDVDNRSVCSDNDSGEVYDASATGEVWYLSPVHCTCIGTTQWLPHFHYPRLTV